MFTANELTNFRAAQDGHMMDTCYRLVHTQSYNGYNEPVHTYTKAQVSTACGLEMKVGNEIDKNTMTVVKYDAILRLPIATIVNYLDGFEITKQNGEDVTLVFDVVSPPQRGPSGIRVLLKRIEV